MQAEVIVTLNEIIDNGIKLGYTREEILYYLQMHNFYPIESHMYFFTENEEERNKSYEIKCLLLDYIQKTRPVKKYEYVIIVPIDNGNTETE